MRFEPKLASRYHRLDVIKLIVISKNHALALRYSALRWLHRLLLEFKYFDRALIPLVTRWHFIGARDRHVLVVPICAAA